MFGVVLQELLQHPRVWKPLHHESWQPARQPCRVVLAVADPAPGSHFESGYWLGLRWANPASCYSRGECRYFVHPASSADFPGRSLEAQRSCRPVEPTSLLPVR